MTPIIRECTNCKYRGKNFKHVVDKRYRCPKCRSVFTRLVHLDEALKDV